MQPLLSICSDAKGEIVHIHGNAEGLKYLRDRLEVLISSLDDGKVEHDHLFTEAWAGEELTATMLASEVSREYRVVNELTIYAWTAEWAEKQGLVPGEGNG